jgi:hypothetical protein
MEYSEQVGANLQLGGIKGEIIALYIFIKKIKIVFIALG